MFSSYTTFYFTELKSGFFEACASAKRLGLSYVELLDFIPRGGKALFEKYDVEEMKEALAAHDLSLSCYSLGASLYTDDEQALLRDVKRHVRLAHALGSPYFHHTLTLGINATPDTLPYNEVLARVTPLAERIAGEVNDLGMTCLYEPQGYYFNGISGLERLLYTMRGEGYDVGICADTGNPLFVDCAPKDVFAHFKDDIRHVHIKDYVINGCKTENLTASGDYLDDCRLGRGIAGVDACLDILTSSGYSGNASLEVAGDEADVISDIKCAKKMLGIC